MLDEPLYAHHLRHGGITSNQRCDGEVEDVLKVQSVDGAAVLSRIHGTQFDASATINPNPHIQSPLRVSTPFVYVKHIAKQLEGIPEALQPLSPPSSSACSFLLIRDPLYQLQSPEWQGSAMAYEGSWRALLRCYTTLARGEKNGKRPIVVDADVLTAFPEVTSSVFQSFEIDMCMNGLLFT